MTLRPSTRKLSDVKRAVRRTFGDEAAVQVDDTDITNWANEAQTEIVEKNHNLKAIATSPSVVGTASYDFPTPQIAQVEAILYDGVKLRNIDINEAMNTVMADDPQREDRGVPYLWYEWAGSFVLYPAPDAVKDITVYFTKYPTDLAADGDLLSVPNKYFRAVVDFCLWKAFELDEDWQAAEIKRSHFQLALDAQAEEERTAENITYPTIQETW